MFCWSGLILLVFDQNLIFLVFYQNQIFLVFDQNILKRQTSSPLEVLWVACCQQVLLPWHFQYLVNQWKSELIWYTASLQWYISQQRLKVIQLQRTSFTFGLLKLKSNTSSLQISWFATCTRRVDLPKHLPLSNLGRCCHIHLCPCTTFRSEKMIFFSSHFLTLELSIFQ